MPRALPETARAAAPCLAVPLLLACVASAGAQQTVDRGRDRGPGLSTSMFGTYIESGQFLLYAFYEHYRDSDSEYKPAEFGYGLERDFRGRYRANEALVYVAYGISDRLMAELEASLIDAAQYRSPDDPSGMPVRVHESGVGDVEGQIRWRWAEETASRPELFSWFETVFPVQRGRAMLIGTSDWELAFGAGMIRYLAPGTVTFRLGIGYADGKVELGEYAAEYLRRVSPLLRVFASMEGTEDEIELIGETQWFLRHDIILKLNTSFGVTSKATDWAPELGILFVF